MTIFASLGEYLAYFGFGLFKSNPTNKKSTDEYEEIYDENTKFLVLKKKSVSFSDQNSTDYIEPIVSTTIVKTSGFYDVMQKLGMHNQFIQKKMYYKKSRPSHKTKIFFRKNVNHKKIKNYKH